MSLTEAHHPTASATTFPEHPALLTRLPRNEVETLCLKAARGAGMPWGLAEEAGFAAGWLAARGVDGPAALLAHLEARPAGGGAQTISGRIWAAQDGRALCPITAGASLDDHAGLPEGVSAAPVMGRMVKGWEWIWITLPSRGRFRETLPTKNLFGEARMPFFDVGGAEVVLSFGANFLETWISPV